MLNSYDPFTELMQYFYFHHNVAILIVVIVAFNTLKVVGAILGNQYCIEAVSSFDLIISFLAGGALANALLFQGVLADISDAESDKWLASTFTLCLVAFWLFIVQLILQFRLRKKQSDVSLLESKLNANGIADQKR